MNTEPHYYLLPGNNKITFALGADLKLTEKNKNQTSQWTLKPSGKGYYQFLNRSDLSSALEVSEAGKLAVATISGKDNQVWKISNSFNGLLKITNKKYPLISLSINDNVSAGKEAGIIDSKTSTKNFGWSLVEVCELVQEAYKPNNIPGTIEAEDFDKGCPGDAYFDRDENNMGRQYRLDQGVDIEVCTNGGFDVFRTIPGEWMAFTVNVSKTASYEISFQIACTSDNARLHIECDGVDKTGNVIMPATNGRQNWNTVKSTIKLEAGKHILKLVFDGPGLSIDKMIFEESK